MNAGEWLAVAIAAAAGDSEGWWRTAASRAYYAAFWHLRTVAEERFAPLDTAGAEVHQRLADAVALWNDALAIELRLLRVVRNRADYEQARAFRRSIANSAVLAAGRIIQAN